MGNKTAIRFQDDITNMVGWETELLMHPRSQRSTTGLLLMNKTALGELRSSVKVLQ